MKQIMHILLGSTEEWVSEMIGDIKMLLICLVHSGLVFVPKVILQKMKKLIGIILLEVKMINILKRLQLNFMELKRHEHV